MNDKLQDVASGHDSLGPAGWQGQRGIGAWFAGRANRKEYWLWAGPAFLLAMIIGMLPVPPGLLPLVTFVVGLPIFFIWIRRMHDLGLSGWFAPLINIGLKVLSLAAGAAGALMGQVALALGAVAALILLGSLPGQPTRNKYGAPPSGGRRPDLSETFS